MEALYFDYNATTPVAPRVFEAMRPYLTEHFGNPGSSHVFGLPAKRAVATAREQVAGLLGAAPEEIVFTGCATESNNMVLMSAFADGGGRLVTTAVEHPAVLMPARELARRGVEVVMLPVDGQGRLDLAALAEALTPETRLVSLMLANNETGVLFPVAEAAALARERGVPVHTDASQAVGKIPVDVAALGVDFLTVAGHKLYAPKGVGALYARRGAATAPLLRGGGQEMGLRSGTENVPHIVALGEACAMASQDLAVEAGRQRDIREALLARLEALEIPVMVHGREAPRLPNTLSIGFAGYTATDILSECVTENVALSAGAACHAGETSVSHVLAAMAVPMAFAAGTLRISLGRMTTRQAAMDLVDRLAAVFARLQPVGGAAA